MATQSPAVRGAAFTLVFSLYKSDGTIIANPGTYTRKVSKDGADYADTTNTVTEVNTTLGLLSLVLTAAEMTADIVTVLVKDDTAGCVPFTVTIYTSAQTAAEHAAIASAVRTECAVELARIDADITSRLAGSEYSAPLDATGMQSAAAAALTAFDPLTRADATADKQEVLAAIGTGGGGEAPVGYVRITSASFGELLPGTLVYAYLVSDTALATPVTDPATVAANGTWHLDLPADDTYTLVARLAGKATVTQEVTT